ncbi:S41 family peptidase [bacterium]|nr:S41 family peptidase [bacterium]
MKWKLTQNRLLQGLEWLLLLAVGFVIGAMASECGWLAAWRRGQANSQTAYRITYSGQPKAYKNVDFDLFWGVWDLLDRKYYKPDEMNGEKMVDGAIAGMVAALGDPNTMYIPPEYYEINQADMAGEFGGIGIEMTYIDGLVGVQAPITDTPAEKAGLQAGDVLVHVRDDQAGVDEDMYNWSLTQAQQKLRGAVGTKVVLSVVRDGYNENQPFEVELVRAVIKVDSVKLDFKQDAAGREIAYIQLTRFGEQTYKEWNSSVTKILAHQPKIAGVILDMRNNPGGYFAEAIHVASEFVADGVVVREKGKTSDDAYTASGNGRLTSVPVVVLVNGGSASSSEIVAGALRDHKRAQLVGETTFGKGTVQERLPLVNDAGLNVTIGQWMLPSGQWINEDGISPDVEVKNDPDTPEDEILERALTLF